MAYYYKLSHDDFLKEPLELHFIRRSKIQMYLTREKLSMSWAAMVPQGVVSQDDFKEQYKIAYPESEYSSKNNSKPTITPAELKARAKANKK